MPTSRRPTRLLAIDIDGTLLDSSGRLPRSNRDAIGEAVEHGVAVILATGRALHFAKPVAQALGVPVALMVNNGAVVRAPDGHSVDGRSALCSALSRDVARTILA